MKSALERARARWERDATRGVPAWLRAKKAVEYAAALARAPLALRAVDELGEGVRTIGWPRIDNQGFMQIGSHTILRSVLVPVELATGRGARLEIGEGVSINYGASVGCLGHIVIGDRCRIGPYVMIVDSDFHDLYERTRTPPPRPVVLEADVWIGAKACVLPGVTIGRGSVVATGAVVTSDVAPFCVVAGVPARLQKALDPSRFIATSTHIEVRP